MSPHPGMPGLPARALAEVLLVIGPVFLLWFANMALTGWLAGRRGWSDGLWTVLAIFFGPVALLAVLFAPGNRQRRPLVDEDLNLGRATYTPGWPREPDPPQPITTIQRLLGAVLGSAIGASGAGILAGVGDMQPISSYVVLGAAAGALTGYWLSGAVKDASRGMTAAFGVGAGFLVISVAGLLIGLGNAITGIATGSEGIAVIPLYLVGAAMFPIVAVLFYPTALAVTLPAAVLWAAVTQRLLRHRPETAAQPT